MGHGDPLHGRTACCPGLPGLSSLRASPGAGSIILVLTQVHLCQQQGDFLTPLYKNDVISNRLRFLRRAQLRGWVRGPLQNTIPGQLLN